jgi:hypothetical protein
MAEQSTRRGEGQIKSLFVIFVLGLGGIGGTSELETEQKPAPA